ncbi:hypothetical protein AJ78_08401 [Emergomyces pasteurianus Ep9510]|uniref:Structure-specific endonuclease subunit SLX4 n=1 Tax=Emergomyces pasteurianus Ep9510 TaxID=1447872 RepID=A0A1J9PS10_9EURO|nr:hypothetical protein AJ78_08401 [Emergomyces pasteurianus Ep9510]
MDLAAIASRSTPQKSHARICEPGVTPITIDSSPAAVAVNDLSSPFSPPSPSALLKTLSKIPSPRATKLQTGGEKGPRHGGPQGRPVLGDSVGRDNEPGTEPKAKNPISKKPKQKTDNPKIVTQTEIIIVDGDSLTIGPESGKKRGTGTTRAKKAKGVADKKLHGRVSKLKTAGSLEPEAKIIASKTCGDELSSVDHDTDTEWDWQAKGLQLEKATKRRLDWTPTKITSIPVVDLAEVKSSSCGESLTEVHGKGALFSNYGFSGVVDTSVGGKSDDSHNAPTTKRLMELQNINNNVTRIPNLTESRMSPATEGSRSTSSNQQRMKAKKPQKAKLTTITSYATAKYSAVDKPLDSDNIETTAPNKVKKKSTVKRSSGRKCPNPGRRKSKSEDGPPVFKVVPPLEAFKSLEGQELLFGTSSQLEYGEPEHRPEEIRDTPNSRSGSDALSKTVIPCEYSSETSYGSSLFGLSGSKNLWSASARDFTGTVFDADELDMSEPPFRLSTPGTKSRCQPGTRDSQRPNMVNIENVSLTTSANNDTPESYNGKTPSFEDEVVCNQKLESTSTQSNCQPPSSTSEAGFGCPLPDKPIFSGFTTAELAKNVAAYGFKPIKSRDKMISLLEKCWETQIKQSNTVSKPKGAQLGLKEPPDSNSRASTRLRNEKPAKSSTKSNECSNGSSKTTRKLPAKRSVRPCTFLIDDNQLSDPAGEAVFPSPSHNPHGDSAGPAQRNVLDIRASATPMVIRSGKTSSSITSAVNLPSLSSQITEAIKSQPRSRAFNGLKQPTWYEKILMYDPIQLEDLAVWLNTDGFGRIGEDREVGPAVVREWCESKGVCCVWKKKASGR